MLKRILLNVVSILYVVVGIWLIFAGFQEKSEISMKQTYNAFQACTYRQAYYIVTAYKVHLSKNLSCIDMKGLTSYLEQLENEKDSLYSQINTFPLDLNEIKNQSADIFNESEVLYNHFVNKYKDVDENAKIYERFDKIFNEAIDKTPDSSIDRTEIIHEITGRTWSDDFIDHYL